MGLGKKDAGTAENLDEMARFASSLDALVRGKKTGAGVEK